MKLLLGLFLALGLALLGCAFLVAVVIATNPWLALEAVLSPARVIERQPAAVTTGAPADQVSLINQAATNSTCQVAPHDLAAIAQIESNFGQNLLNPRSGAFGYGQFDAATWATFGNGDPNSPVDALPAMARVLCARGYAVDRTAALNSYGGCVSVLCLGTTDYATAVNQLAATFSNTNAQSVIQLAEQWIGVPYVFGGCSTHGVDCSCLVQLVYQKAGAALPRTAADQYAATTRLSPDQLQPGDLVFFQNTYMPGISHVGIYIGGGQQINAPTDGQLVSIQSVFDGYWGAHYAGAGRVKQ